MFENKINVQKLLPLKYRISNAGNHLYINGFSPHRVDHHSSEETKYHRNLRRIYLIIMMILVMKFLMTIRFSNTSNNRLILALIGDFMIVLNDVRIHVNIISLCLTIMWILSCIFINRLKSLSWLKPFAMLKGLITPVDVGLYNGGDVIIFLKRYYISFM